MKKILFAALAAFTILGAGTAWAASSPTGVYLRFEDIKFRSQVAANPTSVWDSLTTSRVGAAGASSVLDTTVAIGTEGWTLPQQAAQAGAVDSTVFWAKLMVFDATNAGDCESGADSLGIAVQVSADGVTWTTAGAQPNQAVGTTNPITSRNNQLFNGAFHDRLSLNGAALAAGQPIWFVDLKQRHPYKADLVDPSTVIGWPYMRFVLSFHDAKGYVVSMKVGHWMNSNP